jgi:hypothetical protein
MVPEQTTALTFEKVLALFQEVAEQQKETDQKFQATDRKFQETDQKFQATDRKFQETDQKFQELREETKAVNQAVGKLGHRIGELIEHLTAANIIEKFKDIGYHFTRISREHKIKDEHNRKLAEIDILLENGDFAMVVEVKSLLTLSDVKEHKKRMATLRRYADEHHDTRKYVSAMSGALIEDEARDFALDSGFYLIEQSGDTVRIKSPPQPKVW